MEENKKFLSDKVSTIILTDENLREYVVNIISISTGISKDIVSKHLVLDNNRINASVKTKYSEGDAIYHNDDIYIDIEVNMSKSMATEKKNLRYICNLILKQVPPGFKDNLKKVYQININDYDILDKGDFIYKSSILDERYHIKRNDFIKIIDINMEYLREMNYNRICKEGNDSLEKLLYIFICDDKVKRDKLYSDDKIMSKVNKKLDNLIKEMDEVYLDKEEYWKEVSFEEGEKSGAMKIAKNLKGKLSIEEIAAVTGVSKEEIEAL